KQSRPRAHDARDRVHHHRGCRAIAVDAAFDLHLDIGNAFHDHAVCGDVFGADVHAQIERHVDPAAAFDRLMHAGHLAGLDAQVLGDDLASGDDRLDPLFTHALEIDAEAVADHQEGLFETHVLDAPGIDGAAEIGDGHSGPNFSLQRLATRRCVLDANDLNRV